MRGIRGISILGAVAGTLVLVVPAFAAGGATIASAPTVAYGQQEFGNTATDSTVAQDLCHGSDQTSWWLASVTAGDRLTIDFGGLRSC
jgi:hypothetical protein